MITVAVGFAVGFRIRGSVPGALGLLLVFGLAFDWLFIALGMIAGTPQAAQGLGFMVFPFTFISSAYVPVGLRAGRNDARLDAGIRRPPADHDDGGRGPGAAGGPAATTVLGHPAGYFVVRSLLWAGAIVVAFAPLAVAHYRKG